MLDGVRNFYAARGTTSSLWLGDGTATPQMTALRRDDGPGGRLRPRSRRLPDADFCAELSRRSRRRSPAPTSNSAAPSRASSPTSPPAASSRPTSARIITLEPERPDIGAALTRLSQVDRGRGRSRRFEPPHPQYRALKAALAEAPRASRRGRADRRAGRRAAEARQGATSACRCCAQRLGMSRSPTRRRRTSTTTRSSTR